MPHLRTIDDSGVKMLSKLLESGDLNTMTMSAHVVAKCFENTEVARKNGNQLLKTLLTTFRSLVDPKHIVKSKSESSCLICLSLALLRLASVSVSDEEIIRKEPETRNLWKLLAVSMSKKSRLFINASPLLFSENVDAFESWQALSVKKTELIRNVESQGICDLLSTCARSYASLLVLSEGKHTMDRFIMCCDAVRSISRDTKQSVRRDSTYVSIARSRRRERVLFESVEFREIAFGQSRDSRQESLCESQEKGGRCDKVSKICG